MTLLRFSPSQSCLDERGDLLGGFLALLQINGTDLTEMFTFSFSKRFVITTGVQIVMNGLGRMDSREYRTSGVHQIQRFHCPEPQPQTGLRAGKDFRRIDVEAMGRKCRDDRVERIDIHANRDCCRERSSFGVLKALLPEFVLCYGHLFFRSCIGNALSPHSESECSHGETRLGPSCPFALRDAEGTREPAAVVDWVGHVTSPVSCRAIVCGVRV